MSSSVVAASVTGCSSDELACASPTTSEMCALTNPMERSRSASGLTPGSEVQVVGPDEQSFSLQIDGDGTYAPPAGSVGILYAFANTELTFAVTATDSHGELLEGDIVIST